MNRHFPLFASNVAVTQLDHELCDLIKPEDHEFIRCCVTEKVLSNSYTTNDYRILEKYPEVKKNLEEQFNLFADKVLGYEDKFIITTSWMTKMETGGYSSSHSHKNCFYSGILYFHEYEPNGGSVEFENPLLMLSSYFLKPKENTEDNAGSFFFPPNKGDIVWFPSYLRHRVTAHGGSNTRYSLAFNIIPIGKYGDGDSVYNQEWV
jgi:uncharacterized protein (TIGR02466 family)